MIAADLVDFALWFIVGLLAADAMLTTARLIRRWKGNRHA